MLNFVVAYFIIGLAWGLFALFAMGTASGEAWEAYRRKHPELGPFKPSGEQLVREILTAVIAWPLGVIAVVLRTIQIVNDAVKDDD